MSLNKVLFQGKTADGLSLYVKSINTDADGTSTFNGDVVIAGDLTLEAGFQVNGPVTYLNTTTFQGTTLLNGPTILNGAALRMSGTQTFSQLGIVAANLTNIGATNFNYQKFGSILHITGVVIAEIASVGVSRQIDVTMSLPNGYTLASPTPSSRYFCLSGGGMASNGAGSTGQLYIASQATPNTASRYTVYYNTTSGANVSSITGQLILSIDVTLDQVISA
jgi:hypothetical protein